MFKKLTPFHHFPHPYLWENALKNKYLQIDSVIVILDPSADLFFAVPTPLRLLRKFSIAEYEYEL